MSAWPSLEAYTEALAAPGASLLSPRLRGATARLGPWGAPSVLSGGFAFIYDLDLPGGERKALRLFHSGSPDRVGAMRESYQAVGGLRASGGPLARFLVQASWEEVCLRAGGREVPGVVMDWVEAPTLGAWLEAHYADPGAIGRLRAGLLQLSLALEGGSAVHGDLQTGNLAVRRDEGLVLLDYDGFRIGGGNRAVFEGGHLHFRHPDPATPPGAIDRFPLVAMDLGLAAIEREPGIFTRHSTGENVLFTVDDYLEPGSSRALAEVAALPGLEQAAERFAALCKGRGAEVPSLADFRSNDSSTSEEKASKPATKSRAKAKGPYRGQYPVIAASLLSSVAASVGAKVELVGQVVSVKEGWTKYGKPYVFVNFGDWRASGIKLIWWEEGLEGSGDRAPEEDWAGRWVSATGLIDEAYRNRRFGSSQYSITIADSSQVRLLSEQEARRRLGAAIASAAPEGGSWAAPSAAASQGPDWFTCGLAAAQGSRPSNEELLKELKAETVAASAGPATQKQSSPQQATQPTSPLPDAPEERINWWPIIAVGAFVLFLMFTV